MESVRGMAALVVVFEHLILAFYPAFVTGDRRDIHTLKGIEIILSGTPINLLYNGFFSVAIFFVLSGYVLSHKYFKDSNNRIIFLPLAVKRYVRLLPPVLFSNAIAFSLLYLSLFHNRQAGVLSNSSWLTAYWNFSPRLANMLKESFAGAFFSKEVSYNAVLWTMTYEFFGSLLVFGFIALFGHMRKRFIAYLVAIALFHNSYYLAFILGVLLSDVSNAHNNIFMRSKTAYPFIIILCAGLLLGSFPILRPVEGTMYAFMKQFASVRSLYIWGAFFVITAVLNLPALQAILSKKLFVFMGKISFSMYALHLIFIGSLASYVFLIISPQVSYHVAVLITVAVPFSAILISAYGTYLYIDAKGILYSQAIYNYLTRKFRYWKQP